MAPRPNVHEDDVETEVESDATVQIERYSYAELKEAQRRCGEKAVDAALRECGSSSTAQQKVFQAHVNDLCASVFIAVVRQYDPDTKEDMEPVDKDAVARVAALEKKLKEKEAAVKALREQVPKLAADKTRSQLKKSRKRSADVELTVPEMLDDLSLSLSELEHLKESCEKTSSTIFSVNTKLAQVISETNETIKVIESAMKRPKTAVDLAMEHSPVSKAKFLRTEQRTAPTDESGTKVLGSVLSPDKRLFAFCIAVFMESAYHLGRGHRGECNRATHELRQLRRTPSSELLQDHQQCHVARATHQLRFWKSEVQKLRRQLKTKGDLLEQLRRQVRGSRRACEECDFFVNVMQSSYGFGCAKRHENTHGYEDAPQSQSPSVAPEPSTSWTPEASNENTTLPLPLAPIESPTSASSSSTSSGANQDKARGSLFAGTTLVAIVLLTALPAAILIGVFFMRRRRA